MKQKHQKVFRNTKVLFFHQEEMVTIDMLHLNQETLQLNLKNQKKKRKVNSKLLLISFVWNLVRRKISGKDLLEYLQSQIVCFLYLLCRINGMVLGRHLTMIVEWISKELNILASVVLFSSLMTSSSQIKPIL